MAKKQSFAEKAMKAHKSGMKTAAGEEILAVVKVRKFITRNGHLRLVSNTVKITPSNQSEVFG